MSQPNQIPCCQQVGYAKNPLEAKEFNLALARTRQAMHVDKAVQMMRTGSPSRLFLFCGSPDWATRRPPLYSAFPALVSAAPTSMCAVHRAVVELQRALQENSAARCPVLSAQYDKEDVGAPHVLLSLINLRILMIRVFRPSG